MLNRWITRRSRAAVFTAAAIAAAGLSLRAEVDPSITPTVHPTLAPSSAIQVPLRLSSDKASVWRNGPEQRVLLSGHAYVNFGYRELRADDAAIWLTPGKEGGENTYDVAVYLSGNVTVAEGNQETSTRTVGKELLVTGRIAQNVTLVNTPASESQEASPLVKRGNDLRMELLTRPTPPMHIARIVVTPAEQALTNGWIAKGPNNQIIAGPGEIQVTQGGQPAGPPKPAKPRPDAFVTGDVHTAQLDNETVTIVTNAYFFYDARDGSPPIEFRAQRMVLFSPKDVASGGAASQPATTQAATKPANPEDSLTRVVTGAYMEGDVNIDHGEQLHVHAEQIFYDLLTHRAIMLDAMISSVDEVRNIPLTLRAAEIRQLARGEFAAKKATFSTSEFFTPHYSIGAKDIYLHDVTPDFGSPGGPGEPGGVDVGGAGIGGLGGVGGTGGAGLRTYAYEARDATIDVLGVPIFWWPFLSGDTSKNIIPLNSFRVGNSKTYGLSITTDWDIFGLAGQRAPEGLRADLSLDYFSKRGPAGGVQADWKTDEDTGILRTYALAEQGADRLGFLEENVTPTEATRGRASFRDQHDLGDGLTLQIEASYISDPNFLEQFFEREFDTDKEHETSIYLKKQGETDALTLLGKFNLFDFTATADQVDDQVSTEKRPEVKYWRIGDSILDLFTYYSETSGADVHSMITDLTPTELGLAPSFLGPPAGAVPSDKTFREYYKSLGWTDGDVLRGDTRQELDMPLKLGDAKIVPWVAGRATVWDDAFPTNTGSSTTRVWGGAGVRSTMQFWKVYDDVESQFWDVHRLRHVIEPQFNIFAGATDQDRRDLQPFDRDVEGISGASGMSLALNQKWQTQRGGAEHYRNVDWIVLNVSYNQFWNKDKTSKTDLFYPQAPLRGYFFDSRPELSQVADSVNIDGIWRIGERFRFLGEGSYNLDAHKLETFSGGFAIDQSPTLSYFVGNRYVEALNSSEWTVAADYQLAQKYRLIAAESYDSKLNNNILSSITLIRELPRFYTALTITYDANDADTSVVFTAWPEGFGANGGLGDGTSSISHRGD